MSNPNQLKTQIASLQRKLAKCNVSNVNASTSGRSRKRRSATNNNSGSSSTRFAAAAAQPSSRAAIGRSARANALNGNEGVVRISRTEYIRDVKDGVDWFNIYPYTFPWLHNLSKSFDTIRWKQITILYRPSVSATTDGTFCIGLDWVSDKAYTTKAQVLCTTPVRDGPVWQSQTLPLPSSRLMTRKSYKIVDVPSGDFDDVVGTVVYHNSAGKVAGEIWVKYSVELLGTREA